MNIIQFIGHGIHRCSPPVFRADHQAALPVGPAENDHKGGLDPLIEGKLLYGFMEDLPVFQPNDKNASLFGL